MGEITVILVEDHAVLREGIKRVLSDIKDIKIIGEATTGETGLALFNTLKPDITIMDISMPGRGGLDAISRIINGSPSSIEPYPAHPDAKIIVYSQHVERIMVQRAFDAGARGYVTKHAAGLDIEAAIRKVYGGEVFLSADVAGNIARAQVIGQSSEGLDELTSREFAIFQLLADGVQTDDIAGRLSISPNTVKVLRGRILKKLKAESNVDLTRVALTNGVPLSTFPSGFSQ